MTTHLNPVAMPAPPLGWAALATPGIDKVLSIIGRVAIVYLFCVAAWFHLTIGWDMTMKNMTAAGIPFPHVMNVIAMTVSSVLSLALLFNFKARWAALGLALYVLVVSFTMYGPQNVDWNKTRTFFMKDMAIFGALLAWSCTLAARQDKRLP